MTRGEISMRGGSTDDSGPPTGFHFAARAEEVGQGELFDGVATQVS
jgi:hypothetical protein